ncbi:hypothetical protein ASG87_05015 [Frateuria sp. Soil773]|uniref:hypothetical protein n=1 Tax=Frateuria sp. Soil773 TaxID=1736407 RepID=UPI0006F5AA1B|nr:hypothetical protein [Frateuria sp. Soil773]KRE89678.1 hypothetical protein ASG87_05015 [Frateuria sp. Soil773]
MYQLVALLYFILALAGCDRPGRTVVQRTTAGGIDLVYSRVHMLDRRASFDCIGSSTGSCHYALFDRDCPAAGPCAIAPFRQFALRAGSAQDLAGLPADFRLCVTEEAKPMTGDCLRPDRRQG